MSVVNQFKMTFWHLDSLIVENSEALSFKVINSHLWLVWL